MNNIVKYVNQIIFFMLLSSDSFLFVYAQPLNQPTQELLREAQHFKDRFQFEKAKNLYEEIIQIEPGIPQHYVEISKLWMGLNNVEQSRLSLEKALELDPKNADALTLLAVYYQDEKQDFPKAEHLLHTALELHPNHLPAVKLYLEILIEQQKLDAAVAWIDRIQPSVMPSGYIAFHQAKIAFLQKDYSTALKAFQSAAQQGYHEPELHRYLAQIYSQQQQLELAQKHQQQFQLLLKAQNERKQMWQLLRLNPNDAGRWFALGIHSLSNQELENALSYLDKGLELDANQAKIQSLAGKIALRLNRPKQALSYIKTAVQLQPDAHDDWNNLGVCCMMLNDFQQAVAAFETAIQKGNASPQIQENLTAAKAKLTQN